jgi:hypothetical protein
MSDRLEALLESIDAVDDPERGLVEQLVVRARRTDPALAEAIPLCAIPRRFDAEILGILRSSDDTEASRRLIARLAEYPFVLQQSDRWFTYHDDTRDALLRQWHDDPEQRDMFESLNHLLSSHYLGQRAVAAQREQDFARVASLIQDASSARHAQLAAQIEAGVTGPLLEALYHATLASPNGALSFFGTEASRYAREGRPFVWALLDAMKRYLYGLPFATDERSWSPWLEYWRVFLDWLVRQSPEATEVALRQLLEVASDDEVLKLWVLDDLADVLSTQGRIREAQEAIRSRLELAEATSADWQNLPISYGRLAGLAGQLNQIEEQVRSANRAVELAREVGNANTEASARLALASAAAERGQIAQAVDHLAEAVRISRTAMPTDRPTAAAVLSAAMELAQERAPQLLDALAVEARALLPSADGRLLAELQYTAGLRSGGQVERAAETLQTIDAQLAAAGERVSAAAAIEKVALLASRGEGDLALSAADRALERNDLSQPERAMALVYRGAACDLLGRGDDALSDLEKAAALMEACGQEAVSAGIEVMRAMVAVTNGMLDAADALLETARTRLGDPDAEIWLHWHQATGSVARRRGRWDEAQAALAVAYERAELLARGDDAVSVLRELLHLAEARNDAAGALDAAERAAAWWRVRKERAAYRPSEEQERAARENATGIAQFTTEAADRGSLVTSARDHFRAAAERCPDIPLYWLNLSYACRELGEWADAIDAMQRVLGCEGFWGRPPAVVRQVAELELARARSLLAGPRAGEAARELSRVRETYGHELPADVLVELAILMGDAQLAMHKPAPAEGSYEAALTLAEEHGLTPPRSRCHARVALAAAMRDDLERVADRVRRACDADPDGGSDSWLDDLAAVPQTDAATRAFRDLLRVGASDPLLHPDQRELFKAVGPVWVNMSYRSLRPLNRPTLGDELDVPAYVGRRLSLNADDGLFPHGADTLEVVRMLDLGVPRMRERVWETTGVSMPGLRIRPTALPKGVFRVAIDGVEVSEARVPEGVRPDEAMLEHVEAVVRDHLDDFVDLDSVVSALEGLRRRSAEADELVQPALGDSEALIRFVAVIRSLAADRVPVGDLKSILAAVQGAARELELPELLELARAAVHSSLPGNDGSRRLVSLDAELAAAVAAEVRRANGSAFLAPAHADAEHLLSELERWLEDQGPEPFVVVVEQPGMRRFVASAVSRLTRSVPVLARSEVAVGAP